MAEPFLSRAGLARVLRSLLLAELAAARGRSGRASAAGPHAGASWSATLPIGAEGLECDSLETLWLASAVNEMFHLHEAGTEADLTTAETFGAWLDQIAAAWRSGIERMTFSTSGSTGRPKRCMQGFAHLRAEIDVLAARWTGRRRIIALVPAHHIYGFIFTGLLPDRLGVPVLDADGLGAGRLAGEVRAGDLVVSFPDRWAWLERSLPQWPADVEGVVSTAPCPADLLVALQAGGLARMTEVYGSSETAGIALRAAPGDPYRLMPQWRFDTSISTETPELVHRHGQRFTLMDRVALVELDAFRLAGRRDGMVQIGGVNVSPEAVARKLRERPGVRDAAVRLMRPDEGSRLKAFVVADAGINRETLRASLETWIANNLATAEQPKSLVTGATLPLGVLGKNGDW